MVHEKNSYIKNYHTIIDIFYDFAIEAYQSRNCYTLDDTEATIVYEVLDETELPQAKTASIVFPLIGKYGDPILFRENFIEDLQTNSIYNNKNIIKWIQKNKSRFPIIDIYLGAFEDLNIVTFLYLQKLSKKKLNKLLYKCTPYELGFFYFTQIQRECYFCREEALYFYLFKEKSYCISCLSQNIIVDSGEIIDWIKLHVHLAIAGCSTHFQLNKLLRDAWEETFDCTVCKICQCESYSYIFDGDPYKHNGCDCNPKIKTKITNIT